MTERCIAVFGGSFDPPHVAHVLVAAWVRSASEAERVLVVPTWSHPFGKAHSASYEDRVAMCERAFATVAGVEVSPIERELGEPSRTLHTLEALREREPDARWRLVVGADVLSETDRWHRWDEVIRMAPSLVVGRTGYALPDGCPIAMPDISSTVLREDLSAGRSTEGRVPQSVRAYILDRGLYKDG